MNFLKLLGLAPDPKSGDVWGFRRKGDHPWDKDRLIKAYVKDVKAGWVCYTLDESHAKADVDNYADTFLTTKNFLSIYSVKVKS